MKFISLLLSLTIASFSAPFFSYELNLSSAKYAIVIDSAQKVFESVDTICNGKSYYYLPVLGKPLNNGVDINVLKKMGSPACTISVICSGRYIALAETLDCNTLLLTNPQTEHLLKDTSLISWFYPLPTMRHETGPEYHNVQYLSRDENHLRFILRKGMDSVSVTLSKGQYPVTGIAFRIESKQFAKNEYPLQADIGIPRIFGKYLFFNLQGVHINNPSANNLPSGILLYKQTLTIGNKFARRIMIQK